MRKVATLGQDTHKEWCDLKRPEYTGECTCSGDFMDDEEKIAQALQLAVQYSQIDGAHHKAWVIDQMVRALTGEEYEKFIAAANDGEDGPDTYTWDTGIAP